MARIYPSQVDSFHGSEGERLVYEALERLSHEYIVLYSYRWLGEKGQKRTEGEADFIVMHPQKGILSIEVKAGSIFYQNGHWLQRNRATGESKIIDPFGQAAESQYRIYNFLKQKFFHPMPIIGRAVWFPSICVEGSTLLPLEAIRDIIMDQKDLSNCQRALDRAFQYWRHNVGGISSSHNHKEFQKIFQILMPSISLVETVNTVYQEIEKRYIQLTKQQSALLYFLQEQKEAAIHGPAGTGKTLLALEKARMLAQNDEPVLYLCFNEFLLSYVRHERDWPYVTFHNVRSLAEEVLDDNSLDIEEIIPFFEEYISNENLEKVWPYTHIVIDEGQDLSDILLDTLYKLTRKKNGSFYIFYDRNQYILRSTQPEWIEKTIDCRLVLYKNCRNTSEIARTIGSLMKLPVDKYGNHIKGYTPEANFYTNQKECVEKVAKFIQHMQAEGVSLRDMVILSIHSIPNSILRDIEEIAGVPLSLVQREDAIWITSIRKYKGLESKAVCLVDMKISYFENELMKRILYVGCSRANTYLNVLFWDNVTWNDGIDIDGTIIYSREECAKRLHMKYIS